MGTTFAKNNPTATGLMQGGAKGLGTGLSDYFQQQQGIQNRPQAPMQATPQAPPVDPSYFAPQQAPIAKKANNPFFGGS